jgi:hypothetical protein
MGSQTASVQGDAASTEETFREPSDRLSFEVIRRQIKHLIDLRAHSNSPSIRGAAEKWQKIINAAGAE